MSKGIVTKNDLIEIFVCETCPFIRFSIMNSNCCMLIALVKKVKIGTKPTQISNTMNVDEKCELEDFKRLS
jgi:hypothetical protein